MNASMKYEMNTDRGAGMEKISIALYSLSFSITAVGVEGSWTEVGCAMLPYVGKGDFATGIEWVFSSCWCLRASLLGSV